MNFRTIVPTVLAGLMLALPATTLADRKVKVYRDLDGDGHYNKKTYDVGRHHHRGHYGHRYGHGYGYGGSYYRRPYGYGYGYGYPYSYGPRSGIGFSYSSRPSYYSSTTVYRGSSSGGYSDDLAVDVQRELRRRGYYRGPVDGDVGAGSRSAIRAYQADRGLTVTGRIDSRLLRSLDIG
ncbi:MAG TPA: peptidoglycan-binding domain-containing protein [Chthoniobacteraceae bacterium]|jgi:hypothetical protein